MYFHRERSDVNRNTTEPEVSNKYSIFFLSSNIQLFIYIQISKLTKFAVVKKVTLIALLLRTE